jgi:hypothetical protein
MNDTSTAGNLLRWPLSGCQADVDSGGPALLARPFGQAEDLDVDFRGAPRPAVITSLLALGIRVPQRERIDESELWNWPVTQRTQGLLAIAVATGGSRRQATAQCDNPGCCEWMEIGIDLTMFCVPSQEETFVWQDFELRVPTGEDQMRLASGSVTDWLTLARNLVQKGDPDRLGDVNLQDIETAIAEHDPLTDLSLTASCPNCGRETEVEFDLEAFLLAELERRQMGLLKSVHRLALAHHWSEAEILALPAWRREYYLELLDQEGEQ